MRMKELRREYSGAGFCALRVGGSTGSILAAQSSQSTCQEHCSPCPHDNMNLGVVAKHPECGPQKAIKNPRGVSLSRGSSLPLDLTACPAQTPPPVTHLSTVPTRYALPPLAAPWQPVAKLRVHQQEIGTDSGKIRAFPSPDLPQNHPQHGPSLPLPCTPEPPVAPGLSAFLRCWVNGVINCP